MTVTGIIELSKTRCKVEIDDQFAFVLYKGELSLYHIREGHDIPEDDYHIIMEEMLPKRARLRAMNLLKTKEYTTHQLREKLKQGLYPEQIVEDALTYVASFRYIDDLRYALDYITSHEDVRSQRRIEQDLLQKGIEHDTIRQAWYQWEANGGKQDELLMIQTLLDKKHYNAATADYKEKQRIYAFLLRKGFTSSTISRALSTSSSLGGCDEFETDPFE